jgi:hypothetical protein
MERQKCQPKFRGREAKTKWPKDTQAARNAFYGDPGEGQIGPQMAPVVPPFAMYTSASGSNRFHSIRRRQTRCSLL